MSSTVYLYSNFGVGYYAHVILRVQNAGGDVEEYFKEMKEALRAMTPEARKEMLKLARAMATRYPAQAQPLLRLVSGTRS